MIIVLLLLAAVAILVWGYVKARPFGKAGIFAWLQTVVLMVPWLLFFGFSAAGVYLNLAGILTLVVTSAGLYIYLGRLLRTEGQTAIASQKASALIDKDNGVKDSGMKDGEASEVLQQAASMTESETATEMASTELRQSAPQSTTAQHDGVQSSAVQNESAKPAAAEPEELPPIPAEDLAVIEGIFGVDTFFRTKTVPYQEGAIFRGNLRGQPEETAKTLSQKLTDKFGDRYRSFLLADPKDKPVVVVLPSSNGPKPTNVAQKVLAVALAIATLATCLETAAILQSFDIFQSPERWPEVLPMGLGLVAVLATHEMGHRVLAQKREVKISPPFFLPAWQLGAFGSLVRFESILPNRTVLFDVAFAGPAAGGLLSFIFLFSGLVLSGPSSAFQLPAEFFQGSIFVGTLARTVLGDALQADLVDVHPLLIVGWIGLIITAINLMPAGQLDGGRVVQAIYGRSTLIRASTVT
ncbi:MAG: site-2 protease family protein, partial [Cyanobacteria bacterium J06632_3]